MNIGFDNDKYIELQSGHIMERAENFGGRLCFHGCISTAGPVAYGTADEVEENVRETLAIMMPGYEYAFSPTHCLQDNSPVENVVRMYECALKYGKY